MTDSTPQLMRPQVQAFYEALRANDVTALQNMLEKDFPLEWAQTFAETSLPEYAMSHGSVECAWLLMSHGAMPEKWSAFTGDAWKAFLKKGWEMATSNEGGNLSMEAYRKIAKMGLKVTGQNFPSWMDKIMNDSAATATRMTTSVLGSVGKLWSRVVDRWEAENASANASTDEPVKSPIFVAPIKMKSRANPVELEVRHDAPPMNAQSVVSRRAKATKQTKNTTTAKPTKTVKASKATKSVTTKAVKSSRSPKTPK